MMTYKRIGAAVHNFAHSFVSLMNYFEGEYIIDIIGKVVPQLQYGELRIKFPGGVIEPARDYPKALLASIKYYAQLLPRHLSNEGVLPELVIDLQIVISTTRRGLYYRVEATDNRGKAYSVQVAPG
jgi:hypothetical protein